MENENNENLDSEMEEIVDIDTPSDEVDYKTLAEELEQKNKQLYARAKEAESKLKVAPEVKTEKATDNATVSLTDVFALNKAGIDEEDIPEVQKYAKYLGVSISETLKTPAMKAILQERAENRTTAQASNVGNSKRTSSKVSDDVLLANARKGIMPDTDEEISRLNSLRRSRK